MKKHYLKRLLAFGLVLAMTGSFAACGSDADGGNMEADASEEMGTPESDEGQNEEVDLTMVIATDGMQYANSDAVDEKVAEIVKEELNVNLTIRRANISDYGTSMSLWLSSGEACDLFSSVGNWNNYNQYMLDLEPYKAYMPDALEEVGEYVNMSYVDGQLLGVTSLKDLCSYDCYVMRKDYADETGIDVSTLKTYDDFADFLRAVKAGHPDVYPIVNGGQNEGFISGMTTAERADGTLYCTNPFDSALGIGLADPMESTVVSCFYAEDSYRKVSEYAYAWREEGLASVSDISSGSEQVKAGTAAGYFTYYKPGLEDQETANCGMEMSVVFAPDEKERVKQTNNTFTWSVNKNCANPERAVELLNLFYKNAEINNLLAWGIEGEDYVLVDGQENVINYPEGVDGSSVKYYNWVKFGLPDNYLQYVFEGQDPQLWEKMKVFNDGAQTSLAFGFSFDPEPVTNEIGAVTNVVNEYNVGLTSGSMNPDEILDQFLQDLDQAGMQKILDEAQSQLDAWLAEKE